jgi:hypothetical protein
MKQLTIEMDDLTFQSAESMAQKTGKPLGAMLLDLLKRFTPAAESEFDQLVREEEAIRERLSQSGRQFAASDRLSRDELHSRHALR